MSNVKIDGSRIPPFSKEAEESVIGSILLEPSSLNLVQKILTTEDNFYKEKNKIIFSIMLLLEKKRLPIDAVTVINELKVQRKLETVGGVGEVVRLSEETPSAANIEYWAKIIREKALMRKAKLAAREIAELEHSADFTSIMNKASTLEKQLKIIQTMNPSRCNGLDVSIDRTVEAIKDGSNIIPFGVSFLDDGAGGTTRGGISVLGGRPGHGKTSMATHICKNICNQGYKVLMFNRQIPNEEILKKIITSEANLLSYGDIRHGKYKYNLLGEKILNLNKQQMEEIERVSALIKEKYKNITMIDDVRTLNDTMAVIKSENPDYVIDDYVQLIKIDEKKDRRFVIEDIMLEYEWEAKPSNSNFAGLLLSQLNREIEKRFEPRPKLSDFAEAGTIEQVAESAFFVFYGHNFDHVSFPNKNLVEVIFEKTRYSTIGTYKVGFDGERQRYYPTVQDALQNQLIKQKE